MQLARSGPRAARAASRSRTAPRAASVAPMPAGGLALMTRARRMSHCGDSEVPGASRTASSRARSCTCCPHPSTQRCPGRWDVTGSHCSLQGTDASVQGGATVKWSKLSCRGPCARRCRDEASDSAAEDSGCRGWWGGASRGAELPPVRGGGVGTFRAAAARSSRCCEVSPRGVATVPSAGSRPGSGVQPACPEVGRGSSCASAHGSTTGRARAPAPCLRTCDCGRGAHVASLGLAVRRARASARSPRSDPVHVYSTPVIHRLNYRWRENCFVLISKK